MLRSSEPPYQAMYADFLPGQIRFDCDQLKLTLPMSLCREPNASTIKNYRLACNSVNRCLRNFSRINRAIRPS